MSTSPKELQIEPIPGPPASNPDWQRLGLASGNPFSTWEWANAWWRHFGEDRPQRVLGCHDESGRLVGILPLYLASNRPFRVLRFIGHGRANQLGPICAPEHREVVARAFKTALADAKDWDVCIAERLNAGDGWPELIGGISTRVEPSPTIHFEASDWDGYLASRSANFRQQARRLERRLQREYELSFRLAEDPDRLEEDMDTFLALHHARWDSAGGSISFAGKLNRFHRDVAALALAGGWLRLCFLELDGKACAATYGFRMGNADWYFQAGRDPQFDKQRVGYVLLNHIVREAVNEGMREFKLLLGTYQYKDRYTQNETPVETVVLARNAAVRSALRIAVPSRNGLRSLRQRVSELSPRRD